MKGLLRLAIPQEECSPAYGVANDVGCKATIEASDCAIVSNDITSDAYRAIDLTGGGAVDCKDRVNSGL